MKTCVACGATKPLSEFYKHAGMADGFLNQCKTCKKAYQTDYRASNIEAVRSYDVDRAKTPTRKAAARRITVRMRERHPDKYAAQTAVSNAIRDGRLVRQPCEVCGATRHIHGHHDDYSKPLDVRWLCPVHHAARHAELSRSV